MEEFPGFDVDGGAFVREGERRWASEKCFFILREDESRDKLLAAKQARRLYVQQQGRKRRQEEKTFLWQVSGHQPSVYVVINGRG